MYKKLVLKNERANKEIEIPLTSGVNLIVGPKGGGKSSLLETIAGASINSISKKIKDIFKISSKNIFTLVKIILDSGEEQRFSSMQPISNKDSEINFDENENIISQKDRTKEDLSNSVEIEKFKKRTSLEIARKNEEYEELHDKILHLKNNFLNIKKMYSRTIYWENFQKLTSNVDSANIFLKLDYNDDYLKTDIDTYLKELDEILDNLKKSFFSLEKYKSKANNNKYVSIKYKDNLEEKIDNYLKLSKLIEKDIDDQKKQLKFIKTIGKIFKQKYNNLVEELKKRDFEKNGLDKFRVSTTNHVKELARECINSKKQFQEIFKEPIKVTNNYSEEKDLLTYKLEGIITLNDDDKINLLSSLLYKSNTTSEVFKWLDQAIKNGFKDTNKETFLKKIAEIIAKNIKVFANEKEYIHMSPGERSIFGIKYKLKKSKNKVLFLDQPEDNLDNHTITNEMLDLINNNIAEQTFIVTHNANIGILTNPQNVIIANLDDENEPYRIDKLLNVKDDPKAYFLEGGSDYLTKRYNIIVKGNKNDN